MGLSLDERRRRAMTGDESKEACAHRLRAARFVANVSIAEIASRRGRWHLGIGPTVDHVAEAEAAHEKPNAALQSFYWYRLNLSAGFFDSGSLDEIPIAIEDRLFAALKS